MSLEFYSVQEDGRVVSEYHSHDIHGNRTTDIHIYESEEQLWENFFEPALPEDMQYEPKEKFSVMDALKLIPKLRPHIRDRKFEFVLKG